MESPSRRLESICALLPFFADLREGERAHVVSRFQTHMLGDGTTMSLDSRMVVVVAGAVQYEQEGEDPVPLFVGDTYGEAEVVARRTRAATLRAREDSLVATLDADAIDALFAEIPAIALAFVTELGRELKWRNDLLRDVVLARAERLPEAQIESMLRRRRRRLVAHRRASLARGLHLLWRAAVADPARRPTFWMFVGAVLALVGARSVVGVIIRNGLQKKLFALIGGGEGWNPIHVHHFNYGLLLVSLVGLLALAPRVRQRLRLLAFLFGIGLGLVVDEFALLWNLNPDYYQPSSRLAAALALFILFQTVYLRSLWAGLARRVWARILS